ncbi:hypothetical protein BCR34DRAFT_640576 [Clohesyomyces aquaticus]|uniref:Altered inheritance of mitochondria protein 9, mitochondrial n=1 Tax=Clohesyomyces aquaticus TaxID=1231657 RepID=A0A1Y2A0I1_9PLEO|nr:hypothetical protein BCR34DRAFT_640576 [Clohesyomyces aquaticus]
MKLHEGNFNKMFLITGDGGRELVAKIPNPNVGQTHFTTASEVATMDHVRHVLGIPAPLVYGWSSYIDNPVNAEYILMERSEGVELGKAWHDIPWTERYEVVKSLAGYEKAFVSANLSMYGSLYYAKYLLNLSPSQFISSVESTEEGEAFVVGPTTNVPCPLSFTPEEREVQWRLTKSWYEGVDLMNEVLDGIRMYKGWDGWVNHDNYEVYKGAIGAVSGGVSGAVWEDRGGEEGMDGSVAVSGQDGCGEG